MWSAFVFLQETTEDSAGRQNGIAGDYTYYFDTTGTDNFEDHVTNFYSFSKDKLVIGNTLE